MNDLQALFGQRASMIRMVRIGQTPTRTRQLNAFLVAIDKLVPLRYCI